MKPYRPRLKKHLSECMIEHNLVSEGDRILVGLSGGKDSWALLYLLSELKSRIPIKYSLQAVTIDGGLVGLDPKDLEEGCKKLKVPFELIRQNIFETVAEKKEEGSTFCSLCAKLRRG